MTKLLNTLNHRDSSRLTPVLLVPSPVLSLSKGCRGELVEGALGMTFLGRNVILSEATTSYPKGEDLVFRIENSFSQQRISSQLTVFGILCSHM